VTTIPNPSTTTTTGDAILTGRDLAVGYGGRALFRDLSFDVRRGDILGIVGPNGSGKTTLLRTMLGLLKPVAGQVICRPGLNISYVPQRERIDTIIPVTVLEVVLMGRTARAGAFDRVRTADRDAARRALGWLGIDALEGKLFRNLSAGQKQRVLLAKALATAPDVIVLDEPTSGMDVASEAAMLDFLRDLNRRRHVTIVLVTHMLPIVLNLATAIMLVGQNGVLQGPAADVLREDRLTELYGVDVHVGLVAGQRTLVVGDAHAVDV
jgi:ABC-type Mn2+/Zn2+ transport system ATPase subunit